MVGGPINITLRSRLEPSPLQLAKGNRLIVINDVRRPLGRELKQRYGIDDAHVYDLYSFIDTHKKDLVKGYLNAVDRFFLGFRQLIRSRYYSGNILLYHFSSKRTDLFPTFKRFCILSLRDHIAAQFPGSPVSFDIDVPTSAITLRLTARLKLVFNAARFFLTMVYTRALLGRRRPDYIEDSDVVFYTQYSRQTRPAFDNVNYGSVLNALSQNHKCIYLLSILTDGIHDGAGWRDLYRRSRAAASAGKDVSVMEQVIDRSLVWRVFRLLAGYAVSVLALSNRKLLRLQPDELYVFQDEILPSVRRMFNYAYMLELSKNLAAVIKDKVFVYYLFEHNYGKLLSFYLHDKNITLGCQHGTMCHLRLGHYLTPEERRITTFPTYVIAEGDNHKIALEWIDADVQVQVLGAPRVDSLAALAGTRGGEARAPRERKEVLIPLSLHGGLWILDYAAETLKRRTDVHFYIRPHPASGGRAAARVLKYLDSAGVGDSHSGFTLHTGSVYELLDRVDYVLFADTSVGIEFAECGITPLCVESTTDLNLSPLADIGLFCPDVSPASRCISSADDLMDRLSEDQHWESHRTIPKDFFFAHWGHATTKWAEFLEAQIRQVKVRSVAESRTQPTFPP